MAPKILLIDGDKAFAKRVVKEAKRQGAEVDWHQSLPELGRIGQLGDYDCVIADLSSDPVTGIEIAQYATAFFSDLPVLLVSEDTSEPSVMPIRRLPPSAQARIPKEFGAPAVIRSALRMGAEAKAKMICPSMPRARATTYRLTA